MSESTSSISRREHIITELLTTETTYVDFLRALNDYFYESLLTFARSSATLILTKEEIEKIFQNTPAIYKISCNLLEKIKERIESPGFSYETSPFADIFVTLFNDEKLALQEEYQRYINNYNESLKALRIQKTNEKFTEYCSDTMKRLHNFPGVQSYLITPIQRLPRYILMLNDLKKHTPSGHADESNVVQAVKKINEITEEVDKGKEFYEKMLQKELFFKRFSKQDQIMMEGLINPDDEIIVQAPIIQHTTRNSSIKQKILHRIAILTKNYILITKKVTGKDDLLNLTHNISLLSSTVKFVEENDKPHCIEIVSLDRIPSPPFFKKSTRWFVPEKNSECDWSFWMNNIKKAKADLSVDPIALMARSAETKKHLQSTLLSEADWSKLSENAEILKNLSVGTPIVEEGSKMSHISYIKNGVVDVVKKIDFADKVLTSCYAGDFIGDISFLRALKTSEVKSASASIVTSTSDTSIVRISHDVLMSTLNSHPELAWRFYYLISASIAERFHRINSVLSQYTSFNEIAKRSSQKNLANVSLQKSLQIPIQGGLQPSLAVKSKSDSLSPRKKSPRPKSTDLTDVDIFNVCLLSKKRTTIHKNISEPVLEEYQCKFKKDKGTPNSSTIFISQNHILFYRKVFGKKIEILIPGVTIGDVSFNESDKEVSFTSRSAQREDCRTTFTVFAKTDANARAIRRALEKISIKDHGEVNWKVLSTGSEKASADWDFFSTEQTFTMNEEILKPGMIADNVFQVISGKFRVEIESKGERKLVGTISSGETIGELSFLLGTVTGAYVIADSAQCTVVKCSWNELATITETRVDVAISFYKYLAQMLCKRFMAGERKAIRAKSTANIRRNKSRTKSSR